MNTAIITHNRLWAYLQLMRPANIVTAWADILAGYAVAGFTGEPQNLAYLLLSTTGLYGGGVVFNDVFDTELDSQERPERPIPSGRTSRSSAALLGSLLLLIGVLAATQVSSLSATLAASIALAALLYDAFSKHHTVFGPLNMGMCRGGNLLLGISATPALITQYWFLAFIPITYIAAITIMSRGEVHGGQKSTGIIALLLLGTVAIALFGLELFTAYNILFALPFITLLTVRVLLPFLKAVREPTPEKIQFAVKAGVLSLIILNASIAAGFTSLLHGVLILLLLPISLKLAKTFAVT